MDGGSRTNLAELGEEALDSDLPPPKLAAEHRRPLAPVAQNLPLSTRGNFSPFEVVSRHKFHVDAPDG